LSHKEIARSNLLAYAQMARPAAPSMEEMNKLFYEHVSLAYMCADVMVDVPACTHASNCPKGGLGIEAASFESHEGRMFAPACI
jgi:hypothetical protein